MTDITPNLVWRACRTIAWNSIEDFEEQAQENIALVLDVPIRQIEVSLSLTDHFRLLVSNTKTGKSLSFDKDKLYEFECGHPY